MAIDPKYGMVTVEREPGTPFGSDEPVFILRAQDKSAPMIIRAYGHAHADNPALQRSAEEARDFFLMWQVNNPSKVKEPD